MPNAEHNESNLLLETREISTSIERFLDTWESKRTDDYRFAYSLIDVVHAVEMDIDNPIQAVDFLHSMMGPEGPVIDGEYIRLLC